MQVGWVSIHRSIIDHSFWGCEKFTKAQAWMDLIINANHKDSEVLIKNTFIKVKRGDQVRSILTLSEAWKWDRKTVKRFLLLLESRSMIVSKSTHQTTHITICNYSKFQDREKIKGQQKGQHKGQQCPTNFPTDNNDNNDNNVNNKESAPLDFNLFYEKYPEKKKKLVAEKKWESMTPEKQQMAIDGIEKYKSSVSEGVSYAHPSTYLNQERWNDEPSKSIPVNNKVSAAHQNVK